MLNIKLTNISVIHVIFTAEAGVSEIPTILRGDKLASSENLGTQNYSSKPRAVVTGAGYDHEAVEKMRMACKGTSNLPWLRPDTTIPTPPLGPKYGEAMVERVKVCLRKLANEDRMSGDGVFFY
jgi:hypothetical protein